MRTPSLTRPLASLLLAILVLTGAQLRAEDKAAANDYAAQLIAADKAFCALAAEKGVPAAFAAYADNNAAFFEPDPAKVRGLAAVAMRFGDWPAGATLTWEPAEAEVAASGDLGYTWGTYTYHGKAADGSAVESQGYYVTIWKRQADGSWRYVLDAGNPKKREPAPKPAS